MLISLKSIMKPLTVAQAVEVLNRPGTYPLYGGGLVRENPTEAQEAVDLSVCGMDKIDRFEESLDSDDSQASENPHQIILRIGGAARLEAIVNACADLPGEAAHSLIAVLREEVPQTLRYALALGDVLREKRPTSPLRTWLTALGDRVDLIEQPIAAGMLTEALHVRLDNPADRAGFGWAKVARTPADAPIAAAAVWLEGERESNLEHAAISGLMLDPVLYRPGMPSQYENYLGSAEYRTAIAPVLVQRARKAANARREKPLSNS